MEVIVTGGAGYIGSTICSALKEINFIPIIVDSLVTGNREFTQDHIFFESDISNPDLFKNLRIRFPKADTIIHCAARIIVEESIQDPYLYYRENVTKTLEMFKNCLQHGFTKIVFSSSASVYGDSPHIAVEESTVCNPSSPYASTKIMMESILSDFCHAFGLKAVSLRYFNPIGADPQLRSGQYKKSQSHLLGKLIDSSANESSFTINGNDWPTRDGTPIRDFIHVWDLARAHIAAIRFINSSDFKPGEHFRINIGTGEGTTVKEFVNSYLKVSGDSLCVAIGHRREGDIAGAYAVTSMANSLLKWKAELSIEEGIVDALRWQSEFKKRH